MKKIAGAVSALIQFIRHELTGLPLLQGKQILTAPLLMVALISFL